MITGYVCVLAAIFLLAKVIARKSGNQKLNHFFQKIHKPLGGILLAVIVLHVVITIPVWDTRADTVVITGIVAAVLFVVMAVTYLLRKRYKKAWFSFHRIVAVVFSIMLILHVMTYFDDFHKYKENIEEIHLTGVTAAGVADGSYIGSCDVGYIYAEVEVIVENETIKKIKLLEHRNERGKKAETIISDVIEKQTTDVDAVSGATNSGIVIKKAVENALSGK